MQHPNEHGVYAPEVTMELARAGQTYVRVAIAQCNDGRHRFALSIHTSYQGNCGPITRQGPGYASAREAEDAALADAVTRLPKPFASEPASFHAEVAALRNQLESRLRQPSLF
jgi:hypothetical protein